MAGVEKWKNVEEWVKRRNGWRSGWNGGEVKEEGRLEWRNV